MDFFTKFSVIIASNDEARRLATAVAEETEILDDSVLKATPNYCIIA